MADDARGYSDTIIAAAALGLVWPGDALIYVVLPLYPDVFGIETTAIAILLERGYETWAATGKPSAPSAR